MHESGIKEAKPAFAAAFALAAEVEADGIAARRVLAHRALAVAGPLALGAGYFLAAKLGEALAFPSAPVSAFWAPNALVMAALLLVPRSRWALYLLTVLLIHCLAQLPVFPVVQVAIQYVANTAQAVLGALAIQAFAPHPREFDRLRSATVLIVFGGVLAPAVASTFMAGAFAVAQIPGDFWLTVSARTITNTFAVVAVVPITVHVVERLRRGAREVSFARSVEAFALAALLGGMCTLAFGYPFDNSNATPALLYAPLPLLAWAVLRFGVAGACAASLVVGVSSALGILLGIGPFGGVDPGEGALSVVVFDAITCITCVWFAALLSERRSTLEALRASQRRFRCIFEHNIIPTVIWRGDMRVSEANESFLRLTGFTNADIRSGNVRFRDLTLPPLREEPLPIDLRDDCGVAELDLALRNGRRIPAILGHCRFSDDDGGVIYALDLSAIRRAEAERHSAESLHSAVLASLHDQVAVLDRNGSIIEINDSWRQAVESAHPNRFDRVLSGDNFLQACEAGAERTDRAASEQFMAVRSVMSGAKSRCHLEFVESTGDEPAWVEVSVERLRRPEGGVVITRTDVTARKRAEAQAQNQRQQLAHLGRAAVLGQLSGAFAHELNQPLTSMLGNAEAALRMLANGGGGADEFAEILRDIVHDNERAAQVIQRLRALLGKGDTQHSPVDLNSLALEVLALTRSELITRNVCVDTDLQSALPLVMADRVQVQQVMLNLLINACEAMSANPVGERRILVSSRAGVDNISVEIMVGDNGPGVAPDDSERIFQPFVTTKAHGLGLGLAICRAVAESHHGRLWAESAPGPGARFHFRLPIDGGLP